MVGHRFIRWVLFPSGQLIIHSFERLGIFGKGFISLSHILFPLVPLVDPSKIPHKILRESISTLRLHLKEMSRGSICAWGPVSHFPVVLQAHCHLWNIHHDMRRVNMFTRLFHKNCLQHHRFPF